MAKDNYLPRGDKQKVVWLNNFALKFSSVAGHLGFSADDVTSVRNDAAMFSYVINVVEVYTRAKEQRVRFKDLLRSGEDGKHAGEFPEDPEPGPRPEAVPQGIFPRVSRLVRRIKTHPNYNEAIGKDLGIIRTQQNVIYSEMKPALKLVLKGNRVRVQWKKGNADALHIECDKGSGRWEFLAIDTMPHYTDPSAVTSPGKWKYRAMYMIKDELVGQWSDEAIITVG